MDSIIVMSSNIRCIHHEDKGSKAWTARRGRLISLIQEANPDLIGFQECTPGQYSDLIAAFPEYGHVGISRDGAETDGESTPVFYKKDRFSQIESGTFWLSPTPDIPSRGWGASMNRICTYIRLSDSSTGKELYHFNTHLDYSPKTAMIEEMKLVRANAIKAHIPALITGDFNDGEDSESYAIMTAPGICDAKYSAKTSMSYGTYHGYTPPCDEIRDRSPIDFIFHTDGNFRVDSYKVLVNGSEDNYASDHYPLLVVLSQI